MRLPLNGIYLNVEVRGDGPPLLLLHGFTGSIATWELWLPAFAGRRAVVVDLIGHGYSDEPLDPARYRMERCVEDLLALLDALDIGRTDLLGYSMGGRVALHLAAAAPERVRGLILESASSGLADPAERAARVAADEALAEAIERDGLTAFVDRWERLPLFAGLAALPADERERLRAQRLRNSPLGLANSLRGMGTGRQEPLWERLPELRPPVLLLVGERDTKFCDLGRQMAALLPDARLVVVPGAGHTIHLEQPRRFETAVLQFLEQLDALESRATTPHHSMC